MLNFTSTHMFNMDIVLKMDLKERTLSEMYSYLVASYHQIFVHNVYLWKKFFDPKKFSIFLHPYLAPLIFMHRRIIAYVKLLLEHITEITDDQVELMEEVFPEVLSFLTALFWWLRQFLKVLGAENLAHFVLRTR